MTKFHWDVEVPDEGDLTREQGWAALSKIEMELSSVLTRLGASPWSSKDEESPLTKEEVGDLRALHHRLKKTAEALSLDVLDRLAVLAEKEEDPKRRDWSIDAPRKFPREIRALLDDYHGDIHRYFDRDDSDARLLAFAILEHRCDVETVEVSETIRKLWEPDDKHGDVWSCPQCDDYEPGYVSHEECKRCYGWGYIFGDRPPLDTYDWSEKGRQALNNGQEWTPEMEAEEEARLRAEDTCYKCDEQMPCDCEG
jgi:hypothetical protein